MMTEFTNITKFDRFIHEPARMAIMAVLSACESSDFAYLLNATELSKGNLSAQLKKLREAGYVDISKGFKGNYPHTSCAITQEGRKAFKQYKKQYLSLAKEFTK